MKIYVTPVRCHICNARFVSCETLAEATPWPLFWCPHLEDALKERGRNCSRSNMTARAKRLTDEIVREMNQPPADQSPKHTRAQNPE